MVAGMAIGGCATVDIPRMGENGYVLQDDERRMQKRAEEFSEELERGGYLISDPEMERYLTVLANRLLPSEMGSLRMKVEVKVIRDPSLNAFALPNGRIYVHSGMLATIDNEAEAVALLAHELSHVLLRHSLKQFRSVVNKSAFFSVVQAPSAAFGGNLGALFAQFAIVSSVYGYSRELEEEADAKGLELAYRQGYDMREGVKLFEGMKEFIEDEDVEQPFFFSTHPHVVARIKNYERLLKDYPLQATVKQTDGLYGRLVNRFIADAVTLCLEAGMFKSGERMIRKFLSLNPGEASGYFYLGELYRQRQDHDKKQKSRDKEKEGDYDKALEAYEKAVSLDSAHAASFLGKGRVLQHLRKASLAKDAFQKYLELNPAASERPYLESFFSSNETETGQGIEAK